MDWYVGDGIEITNPHHDYCGYGATITAVYENGIYAMIDGTERSPVIVWCYYGDFRRWRIY